MTSPGRLPRPAVVTVAWWLELAALAVLLLLLWLLFEEARADQGRIDWALHTVPEADPDEVLHTRLSSIWRHAALGAPLLMLALGFGLPARGLLKGSNAARIVVFVTGSFQLLLYVAPCVGMSLLAVLLPVVAPDEAPPPTHRSAFIEALTAGNGDSFMTLVETIAFVDLSVVLLLSGAVVLLSTSAANRWFVPGPAGHPPPPAPPPGQILPGQFWRPPVN